MNVNKDFLTIYRNALISRYLEKHILSIYFSAEHSKNRHEPPYAVFSGMGAELGPSAVACRLSGEDVLIPRYRGYAALLGKGVSPEKIAGEALGKKTGNSLGLGDVAGFRDPSNGIPGYSANLGSMFSYAIGLAFAKKTKHEEGIVVQMFGDGEASRNTFGGALNLAMIWELPILFVCENNGVAIQMDLEHMSATKTISERARGFGMHTDTSSDTEVLSLCEKAGNAVAYVKGKRRPMLFEIVQKRFFEHSSEYDRTVSSIPASKDPLAYFESQLAACGVPDTEIMKLKKDAEAIAIQAISHATAAPEISEEEFFSIYHG